MKATLAAVLQRHGGAYLREHPLSTAQAKAWRAICACRTPALGGQLLACSDCAHRHWQYHSCRNRHCPTCGARAKESWLQARLAQVLDVPYTHLVFALPHECNPLYYQQPRLVIDALFASVQQTLSAFAANPRWMGVAGGQGAFTLVLHTWSQDLGLHIHLHAIMACGVLAQGQWSAPLKRPDYLFPTRALSKVWRGKFMAAVKAAMPAQSTTGHAQRAALWRKDWVVYAKTPLGGAPQVLQYMARYTHRTAIGNERIQHITDEEVVFTARANEDGGKRRVRLQGAEFIRRFLQHILPTGLKRIRHYGLLANPNGASLALARQALHMPAPQPRAQESAQAFMARVVRIQTRQCPACERGCLGVVQTLKGLSCLPLPGTAICSLADAPQPRSGAPPCAMERVRPGSNT